MIFGGSQEEWYAIPDTEGNEILTVLTQAGKVEYTRSAAGTWDTGEGWEMGWRYNVKTGNLSYTDSRTAPPSYTVYAAAYRGGRLLSCGVLETTGDHFAVPSGTDTVKLFDINGSEYGSRPNRPACEITRSQLAGYPGERGGETGGKRGSGKPERKERPERRGRPLETGTLNLLRQVAEGIAGQFGSGCEVVVHDLERDPERSIAAIVNGHVTGRKVGDGASRVVLEQLRSRDRAAKDHLCYLTKTPDGKTLKSSTVYLRNDRGEVDGILAINLDISRLMLAESALEELTSTREPQPAEPERILNVQDLLEDLIQQSVALVGKPAAMMNKEDKAKAVRFLSRNGAFLITKAGDRIASFFGISKYTLYSYIDSKETKQQEGKPS